MTDTPWNSDTVANHEDDGFKKRQRDRKRNSETNLPHPDPFNFNSLPSLPPPPPLDPLACFVSTINYAFRHKISKESLHKMVDNCYDAMKEITQNIDQDKHK
jgi:hypothetical protein